MEQVLFALGAMIASALEQHFIEQMMKSSKPQTDEQKLIDAEMRADVALCQADPQLYKELRNEPQIPLH